jgi:hypothetical protein
MEQTQFLRNAYFEPTTKNTEELANFLNSVAGKSLKVDHLRHYLLKTSWTSKDQTLKARSNLQGGAKYIEQLLIDGIDEYKNNNCLKTAIADITTYVDQLNGNDDTSFVLVSTNTLPSVIHFKHAASLFFKKSLSTETNDSYEFDLLVLYALRLSLEKRIHGILKTDFVKSANNKPVGLSRLIAITKTLQNISYSEGIKWNQIEWVNDWLNHHIHRNLRPYPWIIFQAIKVLEELIEPKRYETENSKGFSFYGSTTSNDLEILQKEIKTKIMSEIPGAKIRWTHTHEVQKLK